MVPAGLSAPRAPLAEEPLQPFVPLVEFTVASRLRDTAVTRTVATANPGVAYADSTWQAGAEAILGRSYVVPMKAALSRESRRTS